MRWVGIQQYTAVDLQDWLKMTLKIKMAYISIFRMGFKTFFDSHLQNDIGKLKMIKWN